MARGSEVSESVKRELWRLANGMCELCRQELDPGTVGPASTAQTAHIKALGDKGPRVDPALPVSARNAVSNLLLLCPDCHDRIDKNNGASFPAEKLYQLKAQHEAWAASLRQAGQLWRMSYSSIDYLNVPRVAMLPGGLAVEQAAYSAKLDPTRPFAGQGMAPGIFVGRVRPVFESWRERAVELDATSVSAIEQGMFVAFNAPMRSRNTYKALTSAGRGSAWEAAPHLITQLGGRTIRIRYDSKWLTTNTARVDLETAEKEPATFAGMGLAVGTSDDEIRLSALFFGKPQTAEGAFMQHFFRDGGTAAGAADPDDFSVGLPTHGAAPLPLPRDGGGEKIAMALHFNELEVDPGQIERETFRQLMRVVPEIRRDLTVAVGSLFINSALTGLPTPPDIAFGLLGGRPEVWSTLSIDALGSLLHQLEVAVAVVNGLRRDQLDDLHEALLDSSRSYLGAVEVKLQRPMQQHLYKVPPRYRLVGADLRLLYGAREYYGDRGDWDHRPHELLTEWEAEAVFHSVSWEEDEERSAEDLRQAAEEVNGWIASFEQGEPSED